MAKSIEIEGAVYEVRELVLGDIQDLLGKEGINFGLELFKRAVHVNGAQIGEAALSVPLKHFTRVSKAVNELNGNPDDEAGKD